MMLSEKVSVLYSKVSFLDNLLTVKENIKQDLAFMEFLMKNLIRDLII